MVTVVWDTPTIDGFLPETRLSGQRRGESPDASKERLLTCLDAIISRSAREFLRADFDLTLTGS